MLFSTILVEDVLVFVYKEDCDQFERVFILGEIFLGEIGLCT